MLDLIYTEILMSDEMLLLYVVFLFMVSVKIVGKLLDKMTIEISEDDKMKGSLEFDLDDRFEKNAHIRAVKATDAYLALYRLSILFDYGDDVQISRETFMDILDSLDIDLSILD